MYLRAAGVPVVLLCHTLCCRIRRAFLRGTTVSRYRAPSLVPDMASLGVSDNPTPLVRSVDRSAEGRDLSLAARVFGAYSK